MTDTSLGQRRDFRTLFDQLEGVALWTASQPDEFEYISDGFEDIWGIPSEEVKDDVDRLLETIHPDDRERVRDNIESSDPQEMADSYEARIVRPDGTVRWGLTRQVLLRDSEGNLTEAVGITIDITEQKRRERELELLNRIVRHDIRNDMAVVLGWAELLDEHVDEERQEYLQKILASGEHIIELTEVARDYVETITSGTDLTVEPVSLHAVLTTELSLREESFPEAEFRFDGVPSDVAVTANTMLSSVFRNLLNNAVQHNDKETPVVEVSCEVREEHVAVRVADNGPGIPDRQKDVVFGKGESGLGSSGTGIGLYLVDQLVRQYGGDVWIEDNDPTGTVVVVQLPRAE
ncbi:PAS domain-containing sensor histidine kinase [Halobellus rufus]|uniref:PAS domain-containing sensor histidine kinase n=1 Tax=Halobellus rufus TaxID=1448860 RepID=UPI00067861EE|nr:PAS domain-containing sensor histidine kinase [Halobellus rufus]